MGRLILITIFVLSSAFSENAPEYINSLAQGMSKIFDDDFEGAENVFDSLSAAHPDDPMPKVFNIIAFASEMQDAEEYSHSDELWGKIANAESLCIARWGDDPDEPWAAFTYGTLLGYRAIFRHIMNRGSIISLWRDASGAADMFKIALSDSSAGDEAANGLGNFYYWFSAKAGLLRSAGLVSDNREEGIALLERAAKKSKISKDSALHSLVFILFDSGDTAGAVDAAEKLIERHPKSRTAMWDMLFARFVVGDWNDVLELAAPLRRYYDRKSNFNICQLGIIAAEASLQMGDTTNCCEYIKDAEKFSNNSTIKKRMKRIEMWDRYKKIVKICKIH